MFIFFAIYCALLSCLACIAKVIVYSSKVLFHRTITVALLAVNVLVHVIFLLVVLGSADFVFGLHFYYDLPLVSTMLAALDMGVFPYFVATRHKDMERKRK